MSEAFKGNADLKPAYDASVTASLAKFGVTDATWLTNNTSGVLGARSIQNIIEAKYVAMFLQTEAYNDYRRTGFPVLVPTVGSAVPSRYPYCTDERLYNAESVPEGITFNAPVWWMSAKQGLNQIKRGCLKLVQPLFLCQIKSVVRASQFTMNIYSNQSEKKYNS